MINIECHTYQRFPIWVFGKSERIKLSSNIFSRFNEVDKITIQNKKTLSGRSKYSFNWTMFQLCLENLDNALYETKHIWIADQENCVGFVYGE